MHVGDVSSRLQRLVLVENELGGGEDSLLCGQEE